VTEGFVCCCVLRAALPYRSIVRDQARIGIRGARKGRLQAQYVCRLRVVVPEPGGGAVTRSGAKPRSSVAMRSLE
jgi:hypothetical protein